MAKSKKHRNTAPAKRHTEVRAAPSSMHPQWAAFANSGQTDPPNANSPSNGNWPQSSMRHDAPNTAALDYPGFQVLGRSELAHNTMRYVARTTATRRGDAYLPGRKLRSEPPIAFVSAGFLQGSLKKTEKPPPPVQASAPEPPSITVLPTRAMASIAIDSPSPASSDSSMEEVVFKGRNAMPSLPFRLAVADPTPSHTTSGTLAVDTQPDTHPETATKFSANQLSVQKAGNGTRTSPAPTVPGLTEGEPDSDTDEVQSELFDKRLGGQSRWMRGTTPWVSRSKPGIGWLPVHERPPMEDMLSGRWKSAEEDYMENVRKAQEEGESDDEEDPCIPTSFASRDIDEYGVDNENVVVAGPSGRTSDDGWDSNMIHDLDNLETSDDVTENIARIISSRTRQTGPQYLVVYEGSTVSEAHWLPATYLRTSADKQLIHIFEAEKMLREEKAVSSESSHSTDLSVGDDDDDEYEDMEDDDDDDDEDELDPSMDDESLARILQKQEDLGMGSHKILLHGPDGYFAGPTGRPGPSAPLVGRPRKRQQRSRGGKRQQKSFPSASLMADVLEQMDPYDGFDIMDTERPSLKPKKKGRRGQPPPELEDPDLDDQMYAAWEGDREAKRLKKAEREELRKQGLLGRKGKAADLSVKYSNGVTMEQVASEIREFIMSNTETLPLPPMRADHRKVIHEFCSKLGINTKSRGAGNDRFTLLSKSLRTTLDVEAFDILLSRGKYRARFGPAKSRGLATGSGGNDGQGAKAGIRPKAGERVGASAPELGPENLGHAMLAKMGWSKGTALGAHNNKGIINPIFSIAKLDKKGLASATHT